MSFVSTGDELWFGQGEKFYYNSDAIQSGSISHYQSSNKASDLIQSFMDYGSVICLPRNPKCDECLIEKFCEARKKNIQHLIPFKNLSLEERFKAQMKLSKLPRNSSKIRIKNRCEITGRSHGVYRKLRISRIALRQLTLEGKIPGMIKSSW